MGERADSSPGSDDMLPVKPGAVDAHASGLEAHRAVERWH